VTHPTPTNQRLGNFEFSHPEQKGAATEAARSRVENDDAGGKAGISYKQITIARPLTLELGASTAPIFPEWVLNGTPSTRTWDVTRSHDRRSNIVVWECTAGSFEWHYDSDETVVVVSGEVFITNDEGQEKRLGPGDLGFFPAGTSCMWRVPEHVRKVAVLRKTTWLPLAFVLWGWNKLLTITGIAGQPRL
jgi:uncharacterized cupin superfamily protein